MAILLHKLVETFGELRGLDRSPAGGHGCCENFRPKATRAFKILKNFLLPCAEDLDRVQSHVFDGIDALVSQVSDTSPRKRRLVRRHRSMLIEDDSPDPD